MSAGLTMLFNNMTTYFQFLIGVSFFNTVFLFVLFLLVLHVIAKLIISK